MRFEALSNDQLAEHLASAARDVANVGLCADELARIEQFIEAQSTLSDSLAYWHEREEVLQGFIDGASS